MKDDNTLIEECARAKLILRLSDTLIEERYKILVESPHSYEETVEQATAVLTALESPITRFKIQKTFVDNYLAKPENIKTMEQGEKTKDELTKEATKALQQSMDIIKTSFSNVTFNDKSIYEMQTKYNTQYTRALTELTTRHTEYTSNVVESEKFCFLLSELHKEHREYKTNLHKTKNKSNDLTPGFRKTLQRQNKYYMKFRAVAGDIDILSASKDSIFKALIDLFDWPDE